jgi:methionyl-tRNA formyltransferase
VPGRRGWRIRFAALGRTESLFDSARAAVSRGHELVLVGTAPAAPEYGVGPSEFAQLAEEVGAAYFCDAAINRHEHVRMAGESGAAVAISVNWPTLIGTQMLDQFRYGVVNAHAGDLPRYRGNATPNWVILAGEDQVVLSLHRMVERLDAGPILAQRAFRLTDSTYIGDVYRFLSAAVPELFVEVLDELETGSVVAREQPDAPHLSLRCFPREPRDGELDWSQPAAALDRLVRASAEPFAGAYSFLDMDKVVVWRAHSEPLGYPSLGVPGQIVEVRGETGEVVVLTGDGVLVLEEVEASPGGRVRAAERIRSTRARFGMDITGEMAEVLRRLRELETIISERSR